MSGGFEIVDGAHPTWRGMRFASLERARRELARSDAPAGRFYIVDRSTREPVFTVEDGRACVGESVTLNGLPAIVCGGAFDA